MTVLPADIWLRVTDFTPEPDRRTLLCVSRTLRHVVLPSLFNVIKIRFGLWESLRSRFVDEDVDLDELAANTVRRTREVMEHIINVPPFARVVRELHVLSYSFKAGLDDEQTDVLLATIRAVPNLQRFQWLGNFPHLPLSVAQSLSKHCSGLQELRIPATHVAQIVPQALTLSNLTALTIVCQLDVDNIQGYAAEHIADSQLELQRLINTNVHLVRLTIYSDLLEDINRSVFERLRELELWGPHDKHVSILQRLLPHSSNLESLAIVEITQQFENIMVLLKEHSHTFPNIRSFKVMSLDTVDSTPCMVPLSDFLRAQAHLEWLDVDMPGLTPSNMLTLLETVSHMQDLRVLGFDLRSISDEEDLAVMASYLSPSLTALHIQISWENIPFSSEELEKLFNRLIGMSELHFLHVESLYTTDLEIVEELAHNLTKLMFIGFGGDFWNVVHSDGELLSEKWAAKEVALRSNTTVGETGEWLLRFHNLLGDVAY